MKILVTIIIGGCIGAVLAFLEWPIEILYILVAIFVIIGTANIVYVNSFSKNLETIAKYLKKHKKEPVYQFVSLMPTASDEELIEVLHKVLDKHKNEKYQAIYGCYLALLEQNTEGARRYIEPILGSAHGNYCQALIAVEEGRFDEARSLSFKKQWMHDSILAHIAFHEGDQDAFERHAQAALDNAGGIQYYVNYHSFEKLKRQLINQPTI